MKPEYICPIITVFKDDGSINMDAMKVLYDRLISAGIDGIAIMGSSGEFYSLNMKEMKDFISQSVSYLKGRTTVYVGTGRLKLDETVELSNFAIEQGADAVLVVGPYYIGAQLSGVETYYHEVLNKVNGNVLIYNYPNNTGYDVNADMVIHLLEKHNNLVGIKDTVGAPSHTVKLISKVKPLNPNFKIYSGFDDNFAHVVSSGGNGSIAALSNLIPDVCAKWVSAFERGDLESIVDIQRKINGAMKIYSISVPFMPAMKYALEKIGLPVNQHCNLPAIKVDEQQKAEVDSLLTELFK